MKKVFPALLTRCTAFSLTSCRVNWFDRSYDVPWYFVAIPVVLIFVIAYIAIMLGTYVCPDCGTVFRPRWYELSALTHFNGRRVMKCPGCGRRGFCKRK